MANLCSPSEIGVLTSISQIRKLRYRDSESLACGFIMNQKQTKGLVPANPATPSSKDYIFSTIDFKAI